MIELNAQRGDELLLVIDNKVSRTNLKTFILDKSSI